MVRCRREAEILVGLLMTIGLIGLFFCLDDHFNFWFFALGLGIGVILRRPRRRRISPDIPMLPAEHRFEPFLGTLRRSALATAILFIFVLLGPVAGWLAAGCGGAAVWGSVWYAYFFFAVRSFELESGAQLFRTLEPGGGSALSRSP